jgi:hypothetical protein
LPLEWRLLALRRVGRNVMEMDPAAGFVFSRPFFYSDGFRPHTLWRND